MNDHPLATGALREGERVTFADAKGRRHSVVLRAGGVFHTTKGGIDHDALIGGPEGVVAVSVGGAQFSVFRRSSEMPLYRIVKDPALARRQGAYSVVAATGLILKRGPELSRVLKVLDNKLSVVS